LFPENETHAFMMHEIGSTKIPKIYTIDMYVIKKVHAYSLIVVHRTFANLCHRFRDYRCDLDAMIISRLIKRLGIESPRFPEILKNHCLRSLTPRRKIEHLSRADSSLRLPRPSLPVAPWNWKPKKSWCLAPCCSIFDRCIIFNGLCNFSWPEIPRRRNAQRFDRI